MEEKILSFLKSLSWTELLGSQNAQVTTFDKPSPQRNIDLLLHHLISEFLNEQTNIPVISEESTEILKIIPEVYWLVDPLDGTSEFAKGVPEYAVSIALIENRLPTLGVIFNPASQEYFSTSGYWIAPSNSIPALVQKKEIYLFSRSEHRRSLHLAPTALQTHHEPLGSIAYKLGLAAGLNLSAGVVSYRPKNLWDIAAGDALLRKLFNVPVRTLEGHFPAYGSPYTRIPSLVVKPKVNLPRS
ncbi:MAG: hypothetical protein K2X47_16000 [Bdellovibrionales bacterium]|nr:hypothetical protein [Bdellovibrionales bacterium]